MDQFVEDRDVLFVKVFDHLHQVEQQPATALDEDLLRRAERNLDSHTPKPQLWKVLQTGEQLLAVLQQDPRPLTRVLEQAILHIPFDELKQNISSEKLEQGLQSPSIPIQSLILTYLQKAADLPSGAAFVACSPSLTKTLIDMWLSVTSTEIADKALDVLFLLLSVDNPATSTFVVAGANSGEASGQGLLWKRLFADPEIYVLLFLWTSLKTSNHDLSVKQGRLQATISQGRLFDFIARVAQIDWTHVTTSSLPEVEGRFMREDAQRRPYGGIMRYAASDMIDPEDYLMDVIRQDFFVKLLGVVEESNNRNVTPRLLEAIQNDAGQSSGNDQGANGIHL